MDVYSLVDVIPLTYIRQRNGATVTGLTVSVKVVNGKTGATLLASTSCPETASGNGIYNYNWTHGLSADTLCIVQYTVSGSIFEEMIFISTDQSGGKTAV